MVQKSAKPVRLCAFSLRLLRSGSEHLGQEAFGAFLLGVGEDLLGLALLQDADFVFRDELAKSGADAELSQYFAVLTDMRSVGVMGDGRTYDYTLALRAVNTSDFMTASWARIPYDILDRISTRIVNEVGSINRIVYDITSKPPATIEWE